MKILITGSNGFIGKNLVSKCKELGHEVIEFDKENSMTDLTFKIHEADFIMHLAGINRPLSENEFYEGNHDLTKSILNVLRKEKREIPILLSSSIQATLNNDYGKSKKLAEDSVFSFAKETGNRVYVFRIANAFGKWCKPNYNSVVATFCNNIANNKEVQINDRETELQLVYIDDISNSFISCLDGKQRNSILQVEPIYNVKLGKIAELIYQFKMSRSNYYIPDSDDGFIKKLYSTYLSYLAVDDFSYPLKMNVDDRGSFTEFFKTKDCGQVSINVSKPGIVKGNHWHHTKNEKFLVVSGEGIIRFRKVGQCEIFEYHVHGKKHEVVDIPVGYTHNIENLGTCDLVTVMWCNEVFDKENPDTIYLEV